MGLFLKEPRRALFLCVFADYSTFFSSFGAKATLLLVYYKIYKRRLWQRGFRRNSYLQAAWDTSIARTSGFMHINISGMKHAIRKTVNLSNQTYLWIDCSIFYKKAYYLRGNLFGATDKSIRRIPTLKSLTDERYNTPSPWKTYEFSLYRRCLTLNFGDNAYHSHSNR